MADTFLFAQLQNFSLAGAGAVIGDTSIVLSSMKDIDGNSITMASAFGSIGFGTIDPGNGSFEEQICFTGLVNNSNGTTTLTGVSSVTMLAPQTRTSGLLKTHSGTAPFVISNTSGFYDRLTSKDDDETIAGDWTFTNYSPTIPTEISSEINRAASIEYVNDVAVSGAPNAAENVKGIVQLATKAQAAAGTSAGSTGARMVIASSMSSSSGTTGTTVNVISNTAGKVASTFIDQTANYTWSGTSTFSGIVAMNSTTSIAGTVLNKLTINTVPYAFTASQGTTSSFLANDGNGNLSWSRSTTFANGTSNYAGDAASSVQNIPHGLGVTPRAVRITAAKANVSGSNQSHAYSSGFYNGTTNSSVGFLALASSSALTGGASIIQIYDDVGASNTQTAVATVDATNIILTWVKVGSPSSTNINFAWEANA